MHRVIVHAYGHAFHLSIVVGCSLGIAGVGIVLFIASEYVQFLIVFAQFLNLRENVITCLDANGIGILADEGRVLVRRFRV